MEDRSPQADRDADDAQKTTPFARTSGGAPLGAAPDLPATSPAASAPTPRPGTYPAIPGFEVQREIASGGMGVVYLARQTKLDRLVALKTLKGFPSDQQWQRFLAEARAVARLSHPNIV